MKRSIACAVLVLFASATGLSGCYAVRRSSGGGQTGFDAPRQVRVDDIAPVFPDHSSSDGFDFSRNPDFGYVGQAFVALLGDEAPDTGKVLAPVGYKVVRVEVGTGFIEDFAVNRGKTNGPASWLKSGGLERPVAARFDPEGTSLYVVDFGVMMHHGKGAVPRTDTGVLWRITREGK